MKLLSIRHVVLFAWTLLYLAPAIAQDLVFLSIPEVSALATGKKWTYVSPVNGGKVQLDLGAGGSASGTNDLLERGFGRDVDGTWMVNDQAQLCLKWRRHWPDSCLAVSKDGEKLKLFRATDLKNVYVEMTVI